MKKELLLGLFMTFMFLGCVGDTDAIQTIGDPQAYEEHDDEDTTSNHYQGVSCLSCHSAPATQADGEDFLSGATVYTALNATSSAQFATSHTIRLVLTNEQILNYRYDDDGGDANSYSEDSRILSYDYTAQVVNNSGVVVNSSQTYSHNYTQLDCNSCHTATGNNGAPGRIVSYDYAKSVTVVESPIVEVIPTQAPTQISFANDVLPILETDCKICHGGNGDFRVTSSDETYKNIENFNGLNITTPTNSLLLTKANGVNHSGGMIWKNTIPEYVTVRDWMSEGGLNN